MSDNNKNKTNFKDKKDLRNSQRTNERQLRDAQNQDAQDKLRAAANKRKAEIAADKDNKRLQSNIKKHTAELAAREKSRTDFQNEQRRMAKLNGGKVKQSKVRHGFYGNGRISFGQVFSKIAVGFTFNRLTHKDTGKRMNGTKTRLGLSQQKMKERNNFASVSGGNLTKSKAIASEEHNLRKEKERLNQYTHENTIVGLTQMNYEHQFASIRDLSKQRKKQIAEKLTPYTNQQKKIEKIKKKKTKAYKSFKREEYKQLSKELDYYYDELKHLKKQYKSLIQANEQKDENVAFEQFLVLSEYQYTKLEEEFGAYEARELFAARIETMMQAMKDRFGFEPAHFAIHLDEGHIDLETGNFTRNIHAQAVYYSYDFKENKRVMTKIREEAKSMPDIPDSQWLRLLGETQNDLWGEITSDLGFQRGLQKKYSKVKRVHSDKLQEEKFLKVVNEYNDEKNDLKISKENAERFIEQSKIEFDKKTKALDENYKKSLSEKEMELYAKLKLDITDFENEKKKEKEKQENHIKQVKKKVAELKEKENELSKNELEIIKMKEMLEEPKRAIKLQSNILRALNIYERLIQTKNLTDIRLGVPKLLQSLNSDFDKFYNQELNIDEEMFRSVSSVIENEIKRVSEVEVKIKSELERTDGFDKRIDFKETPNKLFIEKRKID